MISFFVTISWFLYENTAIRSELKVYDLGDHCRLEGFRLQIYAYIIVRNIMVCTLPMVDDFVIIQTNLIFLEYISCNIKVRMELVLLS
jgi:hypothetical protein